MVCDDAIGVVTADGHVGSNDVPMDFVLGFIGVEGQRGLIGFIGAPFGGFLILEGAILYGDVDFSHLGFGFLIKLDCGIVTYERARIEFKALAAIGHHVVVVPTFCIKGAAGEFNRAIAPIPESFAVGFDGEIAVFEGH